MQEKPALGEAEITDLKNGIALIAGPGGSGKSSTLAALLNDIRELMENGLIDI